MATLRMSSRATGIAAVSRRSGEAARRPAPGAPAPVGGCRLAVRAALGAHKDECQVALSAQLFHECVNPIGPLHRNEAVLHGRRAVSGGRMLVANGVARVLASYAAGLAFQGGREEHRLAPGRTE